MAPPELDAASSDLADVTYSWEVSEGTTILEILTDFDENAPWSVPVRIGQYLKDGCAL